MIDVKTKTLPADAKGVAEAGSACCVMAGLSPSPPRRHGLGRATNGPAVAAIFAAKGRPLFNPLIVHVADIERPRGM